MRVPDLMVEKLFSPKKKKSKSPPAKSPKQQRKTIRESLEKRRLEILSKHPPQERWRMFNNQQDKKNAN